MQQTGYASQHGSKLMRGEDDHAKSPRRWRTCKLLNLRKSCSSVGGSGEIFDSGVTGDRRSWWSFRVGWGGNWGGVCIVGGASGFWAGGRSGDTERGQG